MKVLTGYFDRLVGSLASLVPLRAHGKVVSAKDRSASVEGLAAPVGSSVLVRGKGGQSVEGEVVAADPKGCSLSLLDDPKGIASGSDAEFCAYTPIIGFSRNLLGRTVDRKVRPVDGMGPIPSLMPTQLRNSFPRQAQPMRRSPLNIVRAPGLFRGAKASLRARWPEAGRFLSEIAREHTGPVVAAMIGGDLLDHSLFTADLMEAFCRTIVISEPREQRPFNALRAYRTAMTLATCLNEEDEDVMLLVSWRLGAHPSHTETTAPHDVTSIWSIEQEVNGFDLEIRPGTTWERAA